MHSSSADFRVGAEINGRTEGNHSSADEPSVPDLQDELEFPDAASAAKEVGKDEFITVTKRSKKKLKAAAKEREEAKTAKSGEKIQHRISQ